MEQGEHEKEVVRQHIKARLAIPERIAGAPRLRDDLVWVWDAFSDLTTERSPGTMGPPGHIPWRAIRDYGRERRLQGDAFEHFKEVIKAVDDAYLEHARKTSKAAETGGGATN